MKRKLNVIFMGKDKPSVISGLKFLLKNNVNVILVIGPSEKIKSFSGVKLLKTAKDLSITTCSDKQIYRYLKTKNSIVNKRFLKNIDVVISFLYWKRIKKPLIDLAKIGCINFHPAPLPEYRGLNGYSFAILHDLTHWGVSAHFVDESFDTGDLIKTKKFKIYAKNETSFSLEQKTQIHLLKLFKEIINMTKAGKSLPRIPQGSGKYYSKTDFERLRIIKPTDTMIEIERKCRAFWYPPYEGAYVKLKGKKFTVVNNQILKEIGNKFHCD